MIYKLSPFCDRSFTQANHYLMLLLWTCIFEPLGDFQSLGVTAKHPMLLSELFLIRPKGLWTCYPRSSPIDLSLSPNQYSSSSSLLSQYSLMLFYSQIPFPLFFLSLSVYLFTYTLDHFWLSAWKTNTSVLNTFNLQVDSIDLSKSSFWVNVVEAKGVVASK